jgi:hypothetical protein
MKEIYILTTSYEKNDEPQYTNEPSTFALTMDEAKSILADTLEFSKLTHPDLEVLGYDELHLHIQYTTEEDGVLHDKVIWVRRVRRMSHAV